jgi:hypothetical protein
MEGPDGWAKDDRMRCTRTNLEFDLRQGLGKGLQKTGTGWEKMLVFGRTHIDLGFLLFTFFVFSWLPLACTVFPLASFSRFFSFSLLLALG